MPTPLARIFVQPFDAHHSHLFVDKATGEQPKPGDCFYAPHLRDTRTRFAPQYLDEADETGRPPIVVVLPSGKWWCVDELSYSPERGYFGTGWHVSGSIDADPITLTVTPSVRTAGYHGTLTDGVLSDDAGDHGRDLALEPVDT
jgi:hypothetical protein